jgi:hypothetical protein
MSWIIKDERLARLHREEGLQQHPKQGNNSPKVERGERPGLFGNGKCAV